MRSSARLNKLRIHAHLVATFLHAALKYVTNSKITTDLPYVDAGFSVVQNETIDLFPQRGSCLFEDVVYSRLAETGQLEAEIVDDDFFDIGTPDELARTRKALEG